LVLIADWPKQAQDQQELHTRQLVLQQQLEKVLEPNTGRVAQSGREWTVIKWLKGVAVTAFSVIHVSKSPRDEVAVAAYTFYLSFISGLIFFALVGLMLGSTIIAVVKMLADNALTIPSPCYWRNVVRGKVRQHYGKLAR